MTYEVVVTGQAEAQLDNMINHVLFRFNNREAAINILDDVQKTYEKLEYAVSAIQLCEDPYLESKGYRKIVLESHNYVLLYQIQDDTVSVNGIFHMLEDYRNKL